MSDLVKRLREFTVTGHQPTMLESEAADRIEQLERELARITYDRDEQAAAAKFHRENTDRYAEKLAAEKALADRLYNCGNSIGVVNMPWRDVQDSYRKARGL